MRHRRRQRPAEITIRSSVPSDEPPAKSHTIRLRDDREDQVLHRRARRSPPSPQLFNLPVQA